MYSLTSEERAQVLRACARVTDCAYYERQASKDHTVPEEYGHKRAKTLAEIGQLFAIVAAIEVKESTDAEDPNGPPF